MNHSLLSTASDQEITPSLSSESLREVDDWSPGTILMTPMPSCIQAGSQRMTITIAYTTLNGNQLQEA